MPSFRAIAVVAVRTGHRAPPCGSGIAVAGGGTGRCGRGACRLARRLIAAIACYLPARQASRLDPIAILRR
jgi:hypothetical protein